MSKAMQEISAPNVNVGLWGNIRLANSGDQAAIAKLKDELKGPNAELIISHCGDLAYQVEESLINAMLGKQIGSGLILREKLKWMRAELGWKESPKLERILIDRVVLTWLQLHFAEMVDIQSGECSIERSKYNQHRIDRASRRHLAAVKMLTTVRKKALDLRVDLKVELSG